jgi:hypothetical protein
MTIGWVLLFAAVAIAAVLALLGALWLIRALINSRGADPPAWWAVLLAAGVLLAVPAAVLATYLFLPVPVSERTLVNSMERKTDSGGMSSACSERSHRHWRCSITDGAGSGSARYEVTAGRSCWNQPETAAATPKHRCPSTPRAARRCATFWASWTSGKGCSVS